MEIKDNPAVTIETYRYVQYISYRIVLPGILGFGIVGNILNVIIIFKLRLQRSMDKMERCATMGFIFLAISDLAFCVFGFPSAFIGKRYFANIDNSWEILELMYMLYRPGLLNTCLFSSTWCVVLIAIERYVVVKYPIKARYSIQLRRTVILQVLIPVIAVIINIPEFIKYKFTTMTYPSTNQTYIMPAISSFAHVKAFRNAYIVIWNVFGTVIPIMVLTVCNLHLIRAITRTRALGVIRTDKYSTSRITFILVSLILFYIVLVVPSSILNFIQEVFHSNSSSSRHKRSYEFLVAVVIGNVVQSVNFAVNFMLYFSLHPKFRAGAKFRWCCAKRHARRRRRQYELIDMKKKGCLTK